MSVVVGTRLGAYEILAKIGEGGMGEVYRARDTTLGREVALKVLPEAFVNDPERLARFEREARTLAAINHPNIAHVYGFEKSVTSGSGGTCALVMELVEGDDLQQRLTRGAIRVDEALPIAKQIADALEAAHDQGIVHRDLKPANIKVRPDGTVKVLDFGLAKAIDGGSGIQATGAGLASSPTITSPAMTMRGVILGTAAYMSPEQAAGKPADRRSDLWAFGVVVLEMLTGQPAFTGESVSHVLAAVLKDRPALEALPPQTPAPIRRLLGRCLEKDRRRRLDSAADARLEIEDALSAPQEGAAHSAQNPGRGAGHDTLPWALAAVLLIATSVLAFIQFRRTSTESLPVARFEISEPPGARYIPNTTFNVAVSPNGTQMVFTAVAEGEPSRLWLRSFDQVEPRALPGTEQASGPFWSPDSRSIAFFTSGVTKRIEVAGGLPRTLCECGGNSGAWGPDGTVIVGGRLNGGLLRVPAEGGTPSPLTIVDAARGESAHVHPSFLPDGRILFIVMSEKPESQGVFVVTPDGSRSERVMHATSKAEFVEPDLLLTVHGGALFGHRLDLSTLTIAGEPVHLADDVAENTANGRAGFSVAQTGVLVVARRRASDLEFTLDWYDRAGKHLAHVTNAAVIGMSLSPDGKRLAYHRHDESGGGDIWIADLDRGGTGMRFTFDVAEDALSPVWSPDGKDIAFSARRNGKWGLFRKAANLVGSEELLFESDQVKIPAAWALDGRSMLIVTYDRVGADIGILPLSGDRTSVPYAKSPLFESFPAFSPDGRWIAYRHSTTAGGGSGEIYVNSYPAPGTRFQPSTGPATQPQWRADGKELFYLDSVSGVIFSVSVDRTGEGLQFGPPHKLFDLQFSGPGGHPPAGTNYYNYLVSSDGQKFLIPRAQGTGTGNAAKLTVILNWQELARE